MKYEDNLKGLDFSSLLTCRDLHSAFTNSHATFSQLRIESLPLAHGDLEKMCSPFRRQYFWIVFWNNIYRIMSQIAVNYAYTDPADNKVALVQVIAWCCYRENVAYFTDRYMCNPSSMCERKQSNVWTKTCLTPEMKFSTQEQHSLC